MTKERCTMATSDLIARFIHDMLADEGRAELQRSDLAERFGCVPSQINYVISTRFSPEHGYIVESRRGGGGFIRITRVKSDPTLMIMHTVNAVGERIDLRTAAALLSNLTAEGALDAMTGRLMLSAINDKALRPVSPEHRDILRASIFKHMLLGVLNQ
jgi:transcriptional regulator CtsR